MLRRRCTSEQVTASGQGSEVEAGCAPFTMPAALHPMCLVEDDMCRRLGDPACELLVVRSEPLIVDDCDLGGRRTLTKQRDARWCLEARLYLLEPCFESAERRHDKHLIH